MMTTQMHDFTVIEGGTAPVRVEELAPVARFSLRLREKHRAALAQALGLDLPQRVGDVARAGARAALCLGPDEWLIHAPEAEAEAIAAAGAGAYADAPHSLVEISDREITYAVTGPAAQALLTIACPRDLDRLAKGRAIRTVFDTAQVVLWRDGEDAFRLDVWRSFAPHVRALLDAGRAELSAGL
ncbi:sarcosine oxidase subunit gamma [Limimaricola cinnabarinus]|jgi:sarcosine oxidase subunit gamma|uniref:sarcosine oxidase subunit gamma n=1 Tax=Limimaricola cinnabarinus TaxID=1125964 RepID=UPI002FDFCC5D